MLSAKLHGRYQYAMLHTLTCKPVRVVTIFMFVNDILSKNFLVLSMQYSSITDDSKLEAVQFGYTEIATDFNLTYLTGENDHSVFPGM